MYDLVTENWGTIKDVLAALAPVLAALGVWKKTLEWWKVFSEKRAVRRTIAAENRARRQQWYTDAYHDLVVKKTQGQPQTTVSSQANLAHFHGLTVQQACAWMAEPIPEYLTGWERAKVGNLN